MTDSNQVPADPFETGIKLLFGFRGRIGRGKYWIGIPVALVLAILAFVAWASQMNPTGKGFPGATIPLLFPYFWIHAAVTIKRLRDAGIPVWIYPVFGLGPFAWLALVIEYMEFTDYSWFPTVLGLLAFFVLPGVFRSKG